MNIMDNSDINKNVNNKIDAKKTEEKVFEILDLDNEMLDISLDADVNTTLTSQNSNISVSNNESASTSQLNQDVSNNISPNEKSAAIDDSVKAENGNKAGNILDEAKELAKDAKSLKNGPTRGSKLGEKNNLDNNNNNPIKNELNNAFNEAKDAAKPMINEAKKAANELKEQGKKAAAKAGGTAISAATGGVVPPKLGEWASKKIINKAEKKLKNKANNLKNKASDLKDKVSDKVKNNETLNKVKNKAADTVNKVGKTIKAIKIAKTIKALAPVILGVLGVALVMGLVTAFGQIIQSYLPGAFGNINNEVESESYSKRDNKILEKIDNINRKYPNANGAVVMAAVSYPYYETIQSNEIKTFTKEETEEISDEEEENFFESNEFSFEEDDLTINEEDENELENDPYLNLYSKYTYRKKYEELLKVYNDEGEEGFKSYLKETYFLSDKGYKKIFSGVNSSDIEDLKEIIINDIYEIADLFNGYIKSIEVCSTSLYSAGTVEIDDVLKGNILVDVKVPSCKSGTGVWDCQSVYSSPITLKEYVYGGTYEEFNSMDVEKTAAQMLAIKSFIVQRSKSMGWGIRQDQNGNYVVTARNNTNDLVYCDVNLGCKSGNTEVGDGNAKRDPISDKQRKVFDKAWEKVSDKFIYDKNEKRTVGAFCQSRSGSCDFCKKGSCLAHQELAEYTNTTFESIIGIQYSDYAMIQVEGDFANVTIAGDVNCTTTASLDIDDSNFVYYAQSDYPNVAFCGRTLGGFGDGLCSPGSSICTSGCGLVSMTMVTATLTQNYTITPLSINQEVRVGTDCGPGISGTIGGSMFPYIAEKYGLSVTAKHAGTNAINDIKQGLDEGGLIIASVCGGLKWNNTYTGSICGGHFIVVRGYEGDDVIISDPYQNGRLKTYSGCLLKKDGKCIKHKMDFNTFYNDLRNKNSTLYIIKGNTPFYEIKKEEQTK